jgi:putative endonuclease
MAQHNEIGKTGESIAKTYLQENKFEIVATNWKHRNFEIDIIAKKHDVISIIEVKTRSSNLYGEPVSFVNKQKQKLLIQGAECFSQLHNLNDVEISFDIISIILKKDGTFSIEYIENAFYPTLK